MADLQYAEVEIWVVVGEGGDYEIGVDQDGAQTAYTENIGVEGATRLVKVALRVALPVVVEVSGEVGPEGGTVTLATA